MLQKLAPHRRLSFFIDVSIFYLFSIFLFVFLNERKKLLHIKNKVLRGTSYLISQVRESLVREV